MFAGKMAKREFMEELEASREPGMSTRMKVRLIGGVISLIAVAIIGIRATRSHDESAARAVAEAPRQATIRIAPDGALTWNGLGVTDLPGHAAAERAKPGPLTVIVEPDAKSPAGAPAKIVATLKEVGFPDDSVSVSVSAETLRELEGL